ncbi:thioesterase II family protein [Micromonospora sp. DT4]|uniref:thioesterase II family protein n=1 Tax=Micromonospora sp. DT4 TaxID=3393438 RepID=UPI003CE91F81
MRAVTTRLWDLSVGKNQPEKVALLFPYAGGAVFAVRRWVGLLPGRRVLAMQYPGRGNLATQPFAADIESLAQIAVADLVTAGLEGPIAIVGHSMGAYVAYETAVRLEARGGTVERLIVAGAAPPAETHRRLVEETPPHLQSDDELLDALLNGGGLPAAALENRDLVALSLRLTRRDSEIWWSYVLRPRSSPPIRCDILALGGVDDDTTAGGGLEAWARETTGACRTRELPGGHFFLDGARADVAAAIEDELARPAPQRAGLDNQ